jgi:molecular chaperone HscB
VRDSARERRFAAEHAARLNQAYRTLRDPSDCASYFLGLHGIAVDGKASTAMPPEFLEEMLDQRELLSQARAAKDLDRTRALAGVMRSRVAVARAAIEALFVNWGKSSDRAVLERAALQLAELRYLRRFLDEVEAIEMDALGPTSP